MAEQQWYDLARQVIDGAKVMTIATAEGGKPWAVTVKCQIGDGNVTWDSMPGTRHSKHVSENPEVAFNVTDGNQSAVYGRARVTSTESQGSGHVRYQAEISNMFAVTDEKVGGKFIPPQRLDPAKL